MFRLSPALVVCTLLLSFQPTAQSPRGGDPGSADGASAQGSMTCDAGSIKRESYRLSTDAQALNVTRPRTDWWDGFDASLRTHQNALGDLNDAALTIAERAIDIDPRNMMARSQLAR